MKFIPQESQITLQMEGIERLWALKHRVQIPHYAISEITYEPDLPVLQDFNGRLRMLGTAVPWAFVAGTFTTKGNEREFWYIRLRQPGVMTIELKPDALLYDRVRVTCSDDIAETVTAWWRAKTPNPA
jgi:hypothetical protein